MTVMMDILFIYLFFFYKKAHLPPSCQWYGGLFVTIRMQAALPRSPCICNSCAASAEAYQRRWRQVRRCVFFVLRNGVITNPDRNFTHIISRTAPLLQQGRRFQPQKACSCTFVPLLKWDRPHIPLSTAQGFDRLMPSGVSTVKMYWEKKSHKAVHVRLVVTLSVMCVIAESGSRTKKTKTNKQ